MSGVAIAEVESLSLATKLDRSVEAGDTTIRLRTVPNPGYIATKPYVLIDPYTSYCEVRRVSSSLERHITLSAALTYAHTPAARMLWFDGKYTPELFGAVGNGTTDDTGAINRCTAVANSPAYGATRAGRISIELDPTKTYLITAPINLCEMQGVVLDGGAPHFGATILGQTNGAAMIECIGSSDITIKNLNIYGSNTLTPAVGVFTSRSNTTHGVNSHSIRYEGVQFGGYYTQTAVYLVETESNYFYSCVWATLGGGMTSNNLLCRANELALTPVHATMGDHGYGLYNINYSRCQITGASGIRALHLHDAAGDVHIHDGYLYAATVPLIEMEGGATLYADQTGCEGETDKAIYLNYDAGAAGNTYTIHLNSFSFATPTTHTIYGDDGTTLRNSTIRNSPYGLIGGISATPAPVRLWIAENCDFTGLADYRSGVFDILFDGATGYSSQCKYRLCEDDTLTFSGGAASYGDIVENMVAATGQYLHVPSLRAGSSAGRITGILTATAAWDIGSLADGATEAKLVGLTGVVGDGNWVTLASVTSITANPWEVTSYPVGNGVVAVVTNRTGGVVDLPPGTLRVVAMKVA